MFLECDDDDGTTTTIADRVAPWVRTATVSVCDADATTVTMYDEPYPSIRRFIRDVGLSLSDDDDDPPPQQLRWNDLVARIHALDISTEQWDRWNNFLDIPILRALGVARFMHMEEVDHNPMPTLWCLGTNQDTLSSPGSIIAALDVWSAVPGMGAFLRRASIDWRPFHWNLLVVSARHQGWTALFDAALDAVRVDVEPYLLQEKPYTYSHVGAIREAMEESARRGNADRIKRLLTLPPSIRHHRTYTLTVAVHGGHANVVAVLLADPAFIPCCEDHEAVQAASRVDVLDLLLSDVRIVPTEQALHSAFRTACADGNVAVVDWFLEEGRPDYLGLRRKHVLSPYIATAFNKDRGIVVVHLLAKSASFEFEDDDDSVYDAMWLYRIAMRSSYVSINVPSIRSPQVAIHLLAAYPDEIVPTHDDLLVAIDTDHVDVVSALLRDGRVDPGHCRNEALTRAYRVGSDMVHTLLRDPRVHPMVQNGEVSDVFQCR